MRIVGRDILDEFCRAHADGRKWIGNWIAETAATRWRTPQDIKDRYRGASFLKDNQVIFNVKGNRYRMEVLVAYNTGTVVIQWIGTHSEYTKRMRQKQ
ncbi:MAG: type II toxin-antitoxin system HigB family toxin [Gammaproteobacteria bacterium]